MAPRLQKLLQQAVAAHRAGRLDEAQSLYARVLAKAKSNFDALNLSGLLAHQQGRHEDAIRLLLRALRIKPQTAVCLMRLGAAYLALGNLEDACQQFREALRYQPDLAAAWLALAQALQQQGVLDEARHACERALVYHPDNADALDRLGAIVASLEGFDAAVAWFRKAVSCQPDHPTGWINLGVALAMVHQPMEALPCFDRALEITPGHPHALTGRALALERDYQIRQAVDTYGEALLADPAHHEARSARLLSLHYLDGIPPEQLCREHREYGEQLRGFPEFSFSRSPEPDRPLKVAVVSPDLRAHSVAFFLEPLLKRLSPDQFEVHLFHDHHIVDETSRKLQALAAGWHHTAGLPHEAFVTQLRTEGFDIALDLAGHTASNRLPAFAQRIALVQLSYLGYPNTTGLQQMDYRLTDAVCDPPRETDEWHTEKLVRFASTAWAYSPLDDAPTITPRSPIDEDSPITFGCFNNFSKVSDETLKGWAILLAAVPGSRLLLKAHGLEVIARQQPVRSRLSACGIDPERVDFLGRVPDQQAHLALYSQVDVALDTYPYHGTTTTCEALWMGVPVVTLLGKHHAARVGGSLLTAINRPEWIAHDWADYTRIAAGLANDGELRSRLRGRLRLEMQQSALLDHASQSDRFGNALRECWQDWCRAQVDETARTVPCGVA